MAEPTDEEGLKALGVTDDDEALAALGVTDDTPPAPALPDEPSIASTPYGPANQPSLYDKARLVARAFGADNFNLIPDEKTARGAVASALQGPALNWADEAAGMLAKRDQAIKNFVAGRTEVDPDWAYRNARDKFRQTEGEFREEHPALGIGLTAAGGAVFGGPVQGTGRGALRYAPAAVEGAIGGMGAAEEPEDMGLGAVVGIPLSVAGQVAGDLAGELAGRAISRGAQGVQKMAGDLARKRALAASGYIQKDLKPLYRRTPEKVGEMGQALLEENVIPMGGTVSDVADNLKPAMERYGAEIGRVLREADATGAKFDIEPFLAKVDAEILAPIRGDPVVAREIAEIDRIVNGYRSLAASKGGLSFSEANAMKSRLQNMAINWGNFFSDSSPSENAQQFKVHLQNLFLNSIDDQIGEATTPEIAQAFRDTKASYGIMKDALDKASQGRARMEGNKQFGLVGNLLAGSGLLSGLASGDLRQTAAGFGAAAATKLMSERGPSAMAVGLNRLSGAAPLRNLARTSPEALGEFGQYLGSAASRASQGQSASQQSTADFVGSAMRTNPELLGSYAPMVESAMAQGNLPILHYRLMQTDPAYREQLEQARKAMR